MSFIIDDIDESIKSLDKLKELIEPVATIEIDRLYYQLYGVLTNIKNREEIKVFKERDMIKKLRKEKKQWNRRFND